MLPPATRSSRRGSGRRARCGRRRPRRARRAGRRRRRRGPPSRGGQRCRAAPFSTALAGPVERQDGDPAVGGKSAAEEFIFLGDRVGAAEDDRPGRRPPGAGRRREDVAGQHGRLVRDLHGLDRGLHACRRGLERTTAIEHRAGMAVVERREEEARGAVVVARPEPRVARRHDVSGRVRRRGAIVERSGERAKAVVPRVRVPDGEVAATWWHSVKSAPPTDASPTRRMNLERPEQLSGQ